jgi:hypothetical protein
MRGGGRLALQRLHDHALDFGIVDLPRAALVEQSAEPVLDER